MINRIIFFSLLITFFIFSFSTYGQFKFQKEEAYVYVKNTSHPVVLINNHILGNVALMKKLKNLGKQHELNVIKGKNFSKSKNILFFKEKIDDLVLIEIDAEIIVKTQKELNALFQFELTNDIYVNGFLIDDKKQMIALQSIKSIEIIQPDVVNKLKSAVINVQFF